MSALHPDDTAHEPDAPPAGRSTASKSPSPDASSPCTSTTGWRARAWAARIRTGGTTCSSSTRSAAASRTACATSRTRPARLRTTAPAAPQRRWPVRAPRRRMRCRRWITGMRAAGWSGAGSCSIIRRMRRRKELLGRRLRGSGSRWRSWRRLRGTRVWSSREGTSWWYGRGTRKRWRGRVWESRCSRSWVAGCLEWKARWKRRGGCGTGILLPSPGTRRRSKRLEPTRTSQRGSGSSKRTWVRWTSLELAARNHKLTVGLPSSAPVFPQHVRAFDRGDVGPQSSCGAVQKIGQIQLHADVGAAARSLPRRITSERFGHFVGDVGGMQG